MPPPPRSLQKPFTFASRQNVETTCIHFVLRGALNRFCSQWVFVFARMGELTECEDVWVKQALSSGKMFGPESVAQRLTKQFVSFRASWLRGFCWVFGAVASLFLFLASVLAALKKVLFDDKPGLETFCTCKLLLIFPEVPHTVRVRRTHTLKQSCQRTGSFF